MRPFVSFFTFFSFFSVAALVAARTDIISSLDKQITYAGANWRTIDAPGGGFMYLRNGVGRATLTVFSATQIGVTVMVEVPGDTVRISLDNTDHVVAPISNLEPTWNSSILDPSVPHTITIFKDNPELRYMAFYSLLVTSRDIPTIDTTSASSSTETGNPTNQLERQPEKQPEQQPEQQPELTAATKMIITGAVVGAVCLGLLGVLGIYFWRRRNKHDATLDPFRKVEGGTSPFHSIDALYTRADGVSPLVGEGGAQTETERDRKGVGVNGGTDPAPEGRPDAGQDTSALPLEGTTPFQPPPSSPSDHLSAPPPYVP